jgi:ABC-type transport system substrate-binding protein
VVRANGPVPPGVAGRVEEPLPWSFDLALASNLLVQAGYPGGCDPRTGRRLRLIVDVGRTTQDTRESTELLAAFLDRIGVELRPEYQSWAAFLKKVSRRESQMFRVGWVGDYPDAENFLQLFYGRNVSPGPNRCNYTDAGFDRLYEASLATADDAERLRLYGRMQEIVRRDCPWMFLHFPRSHTLLQPRVANFRPHDFPYGMEKYLRVR